MKMNSKVPGFETRAIPTELDLTYKNRFTDAKIPQAYEALILDAFKGDHSNFVRDDELDVAWKIFTPILHWIDGKFSQVPPSLSVGEIAKKADDSQQRTSLMLLLTTTDREVQRVLMNSPARTVTTSDPTTTSESANESVVFYRKLMEQQLAKDLGCQILEEMRRERGKRGRGSGSVMKMQNTCLDCRPCVQP